MEWQSELYKEAIENWPAEGQVVLAQYTSSHVVVYQAYNPRIAHAIVESQCFHSKQVVEAGFLLHRMTWIKPNFLWMMYRSAWATSKSQERILAIWITRNGFDELMANGVMSSYDANGTEETKEEWQTKLKQSNIRLQWDPDHLPSGQKHPSRRAIQIGIRGDVVQTFSREFISRIQDVTEFVETQRQLQVEQEWLDTLQVARERPYFALDEASTTQ